MSKEYTDRLKIIGEIIRKELPPGTDFSLLVFSKDHAGYSNYVTNVHTQQMVDAMQELVLKLDASRNLTSG